MREGALVDTTFDVRSDSGGRDPDSHSNTLRRFHRTLWSKPLPTGQLFALDARLRHDSALGQFALSSDAITNTYRRWTRPRQLVESRDKVPAAVISEFFDLGCTVGAYLVFPTPVAVDGARQHSINQTRGIHPRIRDRFDLTLECIRRHYEGRPSPLSKSLALYNPFFALFVDFPGYVDFFLLQDLVTDGYGSVQFWAHFDDFTTDAVPASSPEEYRQYVDASVAFIQARNRRIQKAQRAFSTVW